MTVLLSLFRPIPLVTFADIGPARIPIGPLRPRPTPRVAGRRERAAAALPDGSQLLLVCGYALLIALVCSAVLGSTPQVAIAPSAGRPAAHR